MRTYLIYFVVFWELLLSACQGPDSPEAHSPFHPRISAFTSGDISNQSAIVVQFTDSVEGNGAKRSDADPIISFKPAIKGTASWIDARTVVFNPASRLPSNTVYEAQVHLKKLFPEEKKSFFFSFKTIPQNMRFQMETLRPDPDGPTQSYLLDVKVLLSDNADNEAVEQAVSVRLGADEVTPDWSHLEGGQHSFRVKNIVRGESDKELVVRASKNSLVTEGSPSLSIRIPSRNSFEILSAELEQENQNRIKVLFSDGLAADQDLGGLFFLGENVEPAYSIENNEVHLFVGDELSGAYQLVVMPGIKSASGKVLKGRGLFDFSFSSLKPAVEILGSGNIMPWSDGLSLPFKTVSLRSVKVRIIKIFEKNVGYFLQINGLDGESQLKRAGRLVHSQTIDLSQDRTLNLRQWNTFSLALSKFIKPDPGAIYRVEMGFDQEDAIYPCLAVSDTLTSARSEMSERVSEETFWDNPVDYYSPYPYTYNPDYNWRDRDNPCSSSYYTRDRWVYRNVLASNLGLLVKRGAGYGLDVVVTDIRTTDPLSGVKVKVFDLQMSPLAVGETDDRGMVHLDPERSAFLLVAGIDDQRGYLRLDDGRALPVDRFDVSGENVKEGIKGFIFGERGVWRPGDSLFISFMPMVTAQNPLPRDYPVTFELTDPRGRLVSRQVEVHPDNTLYTFRCKTAEEAPTGLWQARVILGGVVFEKNLRVEAIRPNRLKINLVIKGGDRLKSGKEVPFKLSSTWLHGSPASLLKSDVRLNWKAVPTHFDGYHDFVFDDPTRRFQGTEQTIFQGPLDEDGKTQFSWWVPSVSQAPGMLMGMLTSRVFEPAGTFSVDHQSVTISPYASYLGLRIPKGDERGMLQTDTTHLIEVVAVEDDGSLIPLKGVHYTIYKIDWRWWWEKNTEDLGRLISSGSHQVVKSGTMDLPGGKGTLSFRINKPEWGRYLVRVEDPLSGHSSAQTLMVDWPGWAGDKGDQGTASILSFQSDKKQYQTGEDIRVTFPSADKGRALVSIENGSRVIKSWWIEPSEKQTSFSFEATAEMTPNIYVSISLLQPHGQANNNRPVRLYGSIPIRVEDPMTRLYPEVNCADTWRPNHEVVLKVSEKNRAAMDYVVAVVDEGLLDLTRFQTPDPWSRFNAREALGVKTWDLYDQVLGAFGGKIEQLFSIGGDMAVLNPEGENRMRRFEPMVRFLGPFHLTKRDKNTHHILVPEYTGSVRVMVMATDGKATGHADKTVQVKQPLMVWSSMPRLMGPQEQLLLPVTLFSLDKKIKNVAVKVAASTHFSLEGASTQEVRFDRPGEKTLFFKLKTGKQPGAARVSITATGSGEEASRVIPIEIKRPNPAVTTSVSALLNAGEKTLLNYQLPGGAGTNAAVLEVSAIPAMNLSGRLQYLLDYPHGCIEQIVSGAFPQLFLEEVLELSRADEDKSKANVTGVLKRLSDYQTGSGGFAYWPGQSQENDWNSSYAGHFMLQAEKNGFFVSPSLRSGWLAFQKRRASLWLPKPETKTYPYEQMLQAYRLYTLSLAGAPDQSSMNRLRQQKGIIPQARWLLASAYVMAGLNEVGEELMSGNIEAGNTPSQPYTYGSPLRDKALLVDALVKLNRREEAMPVVAEMARALNADDWYSTQTTAFALMGVVGFVDKNSQKQKSDFSFVVNNEAPVTVETNKPIFQTSVELEPRSNGSVEITNRGGKELFVSLTMTGIPDGIDSLAQSRNLILESHFLTMENQPLDLLALAQGTDFKYVVQVQNPGSAGDAHNLALTQMIPSGWEIRNLRLEGNTSLEMDLPDYRDIRDDRVYSYFDLPAGAVRRFVIVCHAAFAGSFYLPPVRCEAMYDHKIRARIPGSFTRVLGAEAAP